MLTDHKPMTFALQQVSDHWSGRQQRHLSFIAEYTADLRHIAGKENMVADALSRPAAAVTPAPRGQVDFAALARSQVSCEDFACMQGSATLELQLVEVEGVKLWCDSSIATLRPLAPENSL